MKRLMTVVAGGALVLALAAPYASAQPGVKQDTQHL